MIEAPVMIRAMLTFLLSVECRRTFLSRLLCIIISVSPQAHSPRTMLDRHMSFCSEARRPFCFAVQGGADCAWCQSTASGAKSVRSGTGSAFLGRSERVHRGNPCLPHTYKTTRYSDSLLSFNAWIVYAIQTLSARRIGIAPELKERGGAS